MGHRNLKSLCKGMIVQISSVWLTQIHRLGVWVDEAPKMAPKILALKVALEASEERDSDLTH
jgi:hypothetical protein